MELPNLYRIDLIPDEIEKLILQLNDAQFGFCPLWTESELEEDELYRFLTDLDQAIERIGSDTSFPYPFYVVAPHAGDWKFSFRLLKDKNKLPTFFKAKARRLSKKEEVLYSKIQVLRERLGKRSYKESKARLQEIKHKQREIYQLAREAEFYTEILQFWGRSS